MMLFKKEFKKIIFSKTFLAVLILTVIMIQVQGVFNFKNHEIEKPIFGQEDYGSNYEEIPEIIMPAALESLFFEFSRNNYTAYPIGLYKNVKLSSEKIERMSEIISDITGISKKILLSNVQDENYKQNNIVFDKDSISEDNKDSFSIYIPKKDDTYEYIYDNLNPKDSITYEEFSNYMNEVDDLIGGGSKYSDVYIKRFGVVDKSYEEALEDYNYIKEKDNFTGAYSRLFSDYMGIIASFIPVFLAVSISLSDKYSKVQELIYTRRTSSFKLIFYRYFALVLSYMIIVIALSYISNIPTWGLYKGFELDYFAALKYDFVWVLPTVMASLAVGMLLTELTETPIAILVQFFWHWLDLNFGVAYMEGGFLKYSLIPRHNELGNSKIFFDNLNTLYFNRISLFLLSIILVFVTVLIYDLKRRGIIHGIRLFRKHS
ncbi:hypothetical protein OF820_06145 [Oceanotoga sp. DSM 15011]|uniref:hypothetical protein n=1 Tax=Oceanotoga sp. DSM 15011 TaxID=2984951 RepID=UPI0021F4E494|nr:hypothetical protein [Oceanotoga sp. DSM 15011]UYP01266.1 hypothetical protein OF820_06145 [Oceanotoga sp. DSM 15011]